MPLAKHKFREIVFQLLFSQDFSEGSSEEMLMEQLSVPKSALREAQTHVEKIKSVFSELDRKIAGLAEGYEFDRIPRVERAILRLGLFELMYQGLPPQVVISEAIRLSRKFSSPESSSFINAILDSSLHLQANQE
jgi:N utilization substance protein B